MNNDTFIKITTDEVNTYKLFIDKLNESGFVEKYSIASISDPVFYFQSDFVDYVVNHGFSYFLNLTISMEDIVSPSSSVSDVRLVFHKFLDSLSPLKELLIIDSYFYANGSEETPHLFVSLLGERISSLETLTVISNPCYYSMKEKMHSAIYSQNNSVKIIDKHSKEFHDRFWINPVNKTGLVVGTSLNGIRKKIFLVDRLSSHDVKDILKLVEAM